MNERFSEIAKEFALCSVTRNGVCEVIVPPGFELRSPQGKTVTLSHSLTIPVGSQLTERQRKLRDLLRGTDGVSFWSMRDLCYALRIDYSARNAGQIGKDLKLLGLRTRKLSYLQDERLKKRINHCVVSFDSDEIELSHEEVREKYLLESKLRIALLQRARASAQTL